MKIAIASDHAGFAYKEKIKLLLNSLGHEVRDFGTFSAEPVDYPLFIRPAAEAVARGEFDRGIVLGGSGNGEAMVANKVRGIRCALCWSLESVAVDLALEIVKVWLATPFAGGRHLRRIQMIE